MKQLLWYAPTASLEDAQKLCRYINQQGSGIAEVVIFSEGSYCIIGDPMAMITFNNLKQEAEKVK